MAWEYGFHNSVNGDRVYNADHMSGIFKGLITDGVYGSVGNALAVQPNSGMAIQIATGRGWFNDRWVNNTSPYVITLADSDVTLNRYAAICVRGDNSSGVRSTVPYVKYSDFATTPVKPSMVRTNDIKEYCLAYVLIRAGVSSIGAADIEDARPFSDVCGFVTNLVDNISPDTLYTQFTAQFNEWFSQIQDDIDTNTKTMLVNALPTSVTVTIPSSEWRQLSDGLTASVTVSNLNGTKCVIVQPNEESVSAYAANNVRATGQSTNKLTFMADSLPTTAIKVDVMHLGR